MQTDEMRAREVLSDPIERAAAYMYEMQSDLVWSDGQVDPRTREEWLSFARAASRAFAAPPAVEREGEQPTLADIEHRSLRLQGESANAHGLTVGEPVSEWIAGRMKDAADRALAPSTPTLHPSDREAIARVVKGARLSSAFGREFKALGGRLEAVDLAAADAIVALSGSLAPAPSGFPSRDVLVRLIFQNTGCEMSSAERAADAILAMEPLTPLPAVDGS